MSSSDTDSDYDYLNEKPHTRENIAERVKIMGTSALNYYIRRRDMETIQTFVENGYSPDTSFGGCGCCYQYNNLDTCTKHGTFEMWKFLLDNTSDEYLNDHLHDLQLAYWYSKILIPNVKFLLKLNNRIDIGDEFRERVYKLENNAIKIQNAFRIYNSKKISNNMRFNPDKLFEPEFTSRRKKILKIDDSLFG